jgi:hypothetical protein
LLCWRKIPDVVATSHPRLRREPERPLLPTPEPPGFSRGEIQYGMVCEVVEGVIEEMDKRKEIGHAD